MTLFQLTKLEYPEDCRRIQQTLIDQGYYCTLKKAQKIWRAYSDSLCAGWLILPRTNEEIWEALRGYVCGNGD